LPRVESMRHRNNSNATKAESSELEQKLHVVPVQPGEVIDENKLKLGPLGRIHQVAETTAVSLGATLRSVREDVLLLDRYPVVARVCPTDGDLILDRLLTLVSRGVAGVDGSVLHGDLFIVLVDGLGRYEGGDGLCSESSARAAS